MNPAAFADGNFGDMDVVRHVNRNEDDEEDDEDIDETFSERLWGLVEMFPEPVRKFTGTFFGYTWTGTKGLFNFGRNTIWIVASSSTIMLLPYLFERERLEMEQMQIQHERQVLLGPHAPMGQGNLGKGPSGMIPMPGAPATGPQ